jgi:hypothetical protein
MRYSTECADSRLVQRVGPLVRHDFRQKKLAFPVHNSGYIGAFTGAFNGVPLPDTALFFNDFLAFVNRNAANYLPPAVFRSVSLARFCLFLPEMVFE